MARAGRRDQRQPAHGSLQVFLPGYFGAKPAHASKAVLNPGTPRERALTSKVAGLRLKQDDLLSVEFAGGGGWGDPYQREVARVREDVVRGLRLAASARESTASCSRRSRRRRRRDRAAARGKDRAHETAGRHRRRRDLHRCDRVRRGAGRARRRPQICLRPGGSRRGHGDHHCGFGPRLRRRFGDR